MRSSALRTCTPTCTQTRCAHTHTHTHTHRWNARCPHAHRTRIHTPASGLHAHPRAHSHTGAHTHTRTVRGHTQAYVAFTQKHSHTRCRVTHACPALHRHPPVCTHSHTTARTYRCVHTRPTPPPPTRIHRCCTHTHCCACTRAFPCMCTHTFTFRHTRDSPVRALAGLAPQLGPTNAAGRAGSSRARSPRAAPAPAPHVCRAPKPLTSTWCAGSGTRSSPGRPSS